MVGRRRVLEFRRDIGVKNGDLEATNIDGQSPLSIAVGQISRSEKVRRVLEYQYLKRYGCQRVKQPQEAVGAWISRRRVWAEASTRKAGMGTGLSKWEALARAALVLCGWGRNHIVTVKKNMGGEEAEAIGVDHSFQQRLREQGPPPEPYTDVTRGVFPTLLPRPIPDHLTQSLWVVVLEELPL